MPLKLNVGLTKKVGLPHYGSLGASCHVELNIKNGLRQNDLEGFQRQVRNAFAACRQAVSEELARQLQSRDALSNGNGYRRRSAMSRHGSHCRVNDRIASATASQVNAIESICLQQQIDLVTLLSERFHRAAAEDLSIVEASRLIDDLKGTAEINGDHP